MRFSEDRIFFFNFQNFKFEFERIFEVFSEDLDEKIAEAEKIKKGEDKNTSDLSQKICIALWYLNAYIRL